MKGPALEGADETLKRNGKSFWFASLFLPRQIAKDAAALYAFCRQVDDLADLPSDESPTARLEQVRSDLRRGVSADPMLKELLRLRSQRGLDLGAAEDLVDALLRDAAGGTLIPDEAGLVRYCYAVAGTVGLMMSAVLGVETAEARLQAIDLGIAMQLTNIARDVAEDAGMARRYLPGSWVGDLPPEQIAHRSLQSEEAHARLVAAIERVLQMADVFYGSAAKGFPAIPASARNGIRIAAAVYREIGVELRRRGCDPNSGRVIISQVAKARIAISVFTGRSKLESLPGENSAHLHTSLAGLPGIV